MKTSLKVARRVLESSGSGGGPGTPAISRGMLQSPHWGGPGASDFPSLSLLCEAGCWQYSLHPLVARVLVMQVLNARCVPFTAVLTDGGPKAQRSYTTGLVGDREGSNPGYLAAESILTSRPVVLKVCSREPWVEGWSLRPFQAACEVRMILII